MKGKEENMQQLKICPDCKNKIFSASIIQTYKGYGYQKIGYWCDNCQKLFRIKNIIFEEN